MEFNRQKVSDIRKGYENCDDEFLKRSICLSHASDLKHSLSKRGRGKFWSYVDVSGLLGTVCAFHKRAGTYTDRVADNIARIIDPSVPLVRFAHTPDFLPYTGVLSNLVLGEVMSGVSITRGVPVMLMVDADTVEDRRMRRARLPRQIANLSLEVPKRCRRRSVGLLPPPDDQQIDRVLLGLDDLAGASLSRVGLTRLSEHILFAGENARNLGEFSSIVWSRLVNLDANLGTVFVSQIETSPYFRAAWDLLWSCETEFIEANEKACSSLEQLGFKPDRKVFSSLRFWNICSDCGRRVISERYQNFQCECGQTSGISVPTLSSDVLSDWLIWGFAAGTTYPGSSSHVLLSLKIAEYMGFKDWAEVIWSGNSIAGGRFLKDIEHSDLQEGRISIVADLCFEVIQDWAGSWNLVLSTEGLTARRQEYVKK